MACTTIDSAYRRPSCTNLQSGQNEFYYGNFTGGTTTWTYDLVGQITGGTANPTYFYTQLKDGTASVVETVEANEQYGSYSIKQTVTLVLLGQSQENRNLANALLGGTFSVIAKNKAGDQIALGLDNGLEREGGEANAGTQRSDPNIITITLSGVAGEFAPTIDTATGTYSNTLISTV